MERTNKLILETEYKVTGIDASVSQLEEYKKATDSITKANLEKVAADKKVEQAANQLGQTIETQTKKQSEFTKAVKQSGEAMKAIGKTNELKDAFKGNDIEKFNRQLQDFIKSARSATSIDELTQKVDEFVDSLPDDIRADVLKTLDKEFKKLEATLVNPVRRLRELKRLINTETDPVLIRRYTEEAGKLQDELGDTNDLVRALASDTFFADTVVEGAQQAVSAFTAFQGVLALTAEDQEEFARAAAKAQGALALLQGTQSILTNLKKQDNIVTRLQIVGQQAYAAVVGNSTGAMKGFRIALAATGIGLAVVALGALVSAWSSYTDRVRAAAKAQEDERNVRQEGFKEVSREITQLQTAEAQLRSTNTTQQQRTEIIRELQRQYPEYLANVNAEKASYDDVKGALSQINEQLLLKGEIIARQKFTEQLQEEKFAVEQLREERQRELDQIIKTQEERRKRLAADREAAAFVSVPASEGIRRAQLEAEVTDLAVQAATLQNRIREQIQRGVIQSSQLIIGSTVESVKEAAKAGDKAAREIIPGTIEFLSQQVSELKRRLETELVAGGDEFNKTAELYFEASKKLEEAQALLTKPKDIEIFTPGSINFLQRQASELEKIVSSLGVGSEEERKAAAGKLIAAQNELARLRRELFGEQLDERKGFNLAELDEEERHQLALLEIDQATEEEKLQVQISFARARLEVLKEEGKLETEEGQKLLNQITELEARINKAKLDTTNKGIDQEREARRQAGRELIADAFNTAQQLISIEQQRLAQLSSLQQGRVQEAERIADRGNAKLLKLEQERLDEINKKQRKFVEVQQTLAAAQLIANSAIAISKAVASQAGTPLVAFTVASTLLALTAGLAQARAAASGFSFKKGGYFEGGGFTGNGSPSGVSTKLGQKPYEYHNKEYIMPDPVVSVGNNLSWLKKIHMERLDIGKLIGQKSPTVIVPKVDVSDIAGAISSPNFVFNLNSEGIISIVEKRQNRMKKLESRR